MKDDSFDCTLIAHLRIFLLFYRLLYCLILPENRLFFGIWKVVEIEGCIPATPDKERELWEKEIVKILQDTENGFGMSEVEAEAVIDKHC